MPLQPVAACGFSGDLLDALRQPDHRIRRAVHAVARTRPGRSTPSGNAACRQPEAPYMMTVTNRLKQEIF
jgi:hypothetical protein